MKFTIDAEFTVDAQIGSYRKALAAVRKGDYEALLEYVTIVDTNVDVRR